MAKLPLIPMNKEYYTVEEGSAGIFYMYPWKCVAKKGSWLHPGRESLYR